MRNAGGLGSEGRQEAMMRLWAGRRQRLKFVVFNEDFNGLRARCRQGPPGGDDEDLGQEAPEGETFKNIV